MKRLLLAIFFIFWATPAAAQSDAELWAALREGEAFVMIRHALAPGTGDPTSFILEDCGTQRNLDGQGRDQAAAIGALFRDAGIRAPAVYSSQWCRCLDTAELMNIGLF